MILLLSFRIIQLIQHTKYSLPLAIHQLNKHSIQNRLSIIAEVIIVLILGFGIFIYASTIAIIQDSDRSNSQTYTSYDFIFICVYEIVILVVIGYILKYRQWKINDFHLDFKLKMLWIAILLDMLRLTLGSILTQGLITLKMANHELITQNPISLHVNTVSIVFIILINSIYEEVLLIGYFFKRFEKFHPTLIILMSFVIRASYHTYQGWMHLPMVFILALIFGIYYIRYRKLWPLILAHAIGNIFHFFNDQLQWIELL